MPAGGVTVQVDSTGFQNMVNELSRLSGKSFAHVLVHQVGALLKVCLRKTAAASAASIVKRITSNRGTTGFVEFASGEVVSFWRKADTQMFLDTSNFVPAKGQKPPRLIGNKSWHDMGGEGGMPRHWSDERWGRYIALMGQAADIISGRLSAAKKARGISKQSWLQIAADLGLVLDAPAYVRNAAPSNGKTYKNGTARKLLAAASMLIEIRNDHPVINAMRRPSGQEILQGAIRTRLKAFEYETKKGVFADMATRAKRYPGIFTTT